MRTPTWDELERFLRIDGWQDDGSTDHQRFRKTLPDGTVLKTRRSFAGRKTMSAGRFAAILRNQLRVSAEDFWQALKTGKPVPRPSTPPAPNQEALPAYIVRILRHELGMSEKQIAELTREQAERLIQEHWSKPR